MPILPNMHGVTYAIIAYLVCNMQLPLSPCRTTRHVRRCSVISQTKSLPVFKMTLE